MSVCVREKESKNNEVLSDTINNCFLGWQFFLFTIFLKLDTNTKVDDYEFCSC